MRAASCHRSSGSCALVLMALVVSAFLGACAQQDSTRSSPASSPRRDPPSSELYFRRFLQDRGIDVVRMTPSQGVGAMLDFYDAAKFNVMDNGDVLRVTWKTRGAQSVFMVSRELTWTAGNPNGHVERWALWLKYEFDRLDRTSVEGDGSHRCSGPRARDECEAFIRMLSLSHVIATRSDGDVQVGFDQVTSN